MAYGFVTTSTQPRSTAGGSASGGGGGYSMDPYQPQQEDDTGGSRIGAAATSMGYTPPSATGAGGYGSGSAFGGSRIGEAATSMGYTPSGGRPGSTEGSPGSYNATPAENPYPPWDDRNYVGEGIGTPVSQPAPYSSGAGSLFNSDGSLNADMFGGYGGGGGLQNLMHSGSGGRQWSGTNNNNIDAFGTPANDEEWGWYGANAENLAAYAQNQLPIQQAQYNQDLQNREYNRNVYTDDRNFAHQSGLDLAGQQLDQNQFALGAWGAQTAANQWDAGFAHTKKIDALNHTLNQQAANTDEMYKRGQITDLQRRTALAEIKQQQDSINVNRDMDIKQELGRGRLQIDQQLANVQEQRAQVDEMFKQGQITDLQRRTALAELTQQQDEAFRYSQMGQQESQFGRTLQSTDTWRGTQADLQREQMQTSRDNTIMQQWGRNQAPNVRWLG